MAAKLYRDYNSYLRETFGCRVQKITLDAGLSCPNRDGTVGHGGCIYCNEKGSGTGAAAFAGIAEQIGAGKQILARKYKAGKFIAYFQSFSNTYAPLPRLAALYDEALADPDIVGLSIGTRPDLCFRTKLWTTWQFLAKITSSAWNTACSLQRMRRWRASTGAIQWRLSLTLSNVLLKEKSLSART